MAHRSQRLAMELLGSATSCTGRVPPVPVARLPSSREHVPRRREGPRDISGEAASLPRTTTCSGEGSSLISLHPREHAPMPSGEATYLLPAATRPELRRACAPDLAQEHALQHAAV